MRRWLLVALVLGGGCFFCSGAGLLWALAAADDSSPAGGSSGGPRATAGACAGTIDGWQQALTEGGVVLTRGELRAELPWGFPFTDALRQGDSELNVWRAVLGSRYEPGQLVRAGYGELYLGGPATERSSGRKVYVAFTTGAANGIANPVVVIGPDESTLRTFASSGALNALQSLNRFPLSCADVAGHWKSGFNTVAERYAAGTGRFVAVEAVAGWRDMQLESGTYRRESSALLHGVFEKRVDSGDWSHDAWGLVLEPEGADAIAYDASFVAVQNGFLLRLTNRKFTGDTEEFTRVE